MNFLVLPESPLTSHTILLHNPIRPNIPYITASLNTVQTQLMETKMDQSTNNFSTITFTPHILSESVPNLTFTLTGNKDTASPYKPRLRMFNSQLKVISGFLQSSGNSTLNKITGILNRVRPPRLILVHLRVSSIPVNRIKIFSSELTEDQPSSIQGDHKLSDPSNWIRQSIKNH